MDKSMPVAYPALHLILIRCLRALLGGVLSLPVTQLQPGCSLPMSALAWLLPAEPDESKSISTRLLK